MGSSSAGAASLSAVDSIGLSLKCLENEISPVLLSAVSSTVLRTSVAHRIRTSFLVSTHCEETTLTNLHWAFLV